jgi:hypothetical protein
MLHSWCERRTRRPAANRRTTISEQPDTENTPIRDSINYRRHRGACPHYRENWTPGEGHDGAGEEVLYQIICLMDTPPVTKDEQHLCMQSPTSCWRLRHAADRANGREKKNGSADSRGKRNGSNGHEAEAEEPAKTRKSPRR